MPVDYKNGKIYKIESLEGECVYYGSTTQKLCVRMAEHKRRFKNIDVPRSASNVVKYNDAKIYLVENYPCNTKEELCSREGYYIKNNDCVNRYVAGRDYKQWYEDNKEDRLKKKKQHYQENKEDILKRTKQKYEKIKNNQHFKEKRKKYRDSYKEKYICECGSIIAYRDKYRHVKTIKHKTLLNNPFINFKL